MSNRPLQNDRQQRLEVVIGAYLEAIDGGESVDTQQLLDEHPDLRPELSEFFSNQAELDQLVAPLRNPSVDVPKFGDERRATVPADETSVQRKPDDVTAPDRAPGDNALAEFRDFELVREIGRGGMGVVFEARQVSLNRRVALKMVQLGRFSDNADLLRLQNEAETAAALDHPAIVPIYEVGHHEDQFFFSMKLIEGGSLSERSDAYRDDPPAAARIAARIAEAVDHAHQRGVLHRDLKPGNVLIDAEGAPHITDFGLARRVESDIHLTQTGAILGTPSYMAPEQAAGETRAVTTSADVYGVGTILYYLLTGRPPFQSSSVITTLEQVRHQPVVSPSKVNQRVPRDLEAICLKCLEKEPSARYASASGLGDDLNRFVSGQPVQARPVGALGRAVKFARRNRGLVALIAIFVIGLVAATTVSTVFGIREHRQRQKSDALLTETQQLFDEIKSLNLDLVFDFSKRIATLEGATEVRHGLLTRLAMNLEALKKKTQNDPPTQLRVASAYVELADVLGGRQLSNVGKYLDARTNYWAALDIALPLYEANPNNRELILLISKVRLRLANLMIGQTEFVDAEEHCESVIEMLDAYEGETNLAMLKEKSFAFGILCPARGLQGDHTGALEAIAAAVDIDRQLLDAVPDNLAFQFSLASRLAQLGATEHKHAKLAEAESHFAEAVQLLEQLIEIDPQHARYRASLVSALYSFCHLPLERRDFGRFHEMVDRGLEHADRLAEKDPADTNPRRLKSELLFMRGQGFEERGNVLAEKSEDGSPDWEAAIAAYLECLELFKLRESAGELLPHEKGHIERIKQQIRGVEELIEGGSGTSPPTSSA